MPDIKELLLAPEARTETLTPPRTVNQQRANPRFDLPLLFVVLLLVPVVMVRLIDTASEGQTVALARTGKTVLFSTHMMDQAERICERVHIIDQARTVLDGRLSEIKDRFGTRTIHVEADGDASFLRDDPAVAELTAYPNYLEIEPAAAVAPERILERLTERLRVRRFEAVSSPSLHRIFKEHVKR